MKTAEKKKELRDRAMKGTIHIRFKDQYLLDDFNAIAAKGKQWLGGEGF